MNVLLINSNMLKPPITPLGLAYVAKATKDAGHTVAVLDLNFSDDIEKDIKETVKFSPDVIGISIRNIDNATMLHSVYFIPAIKKIVHLCKEYTDAPIVLGGPGFSMMPKEIMNQLDVPFGIVGEGEIAFVMLLNYIEKGLKLQAAATTVRQGEPNETVFEGKLPKGLRPGLAELSSALPIIKRSYRSSEQTENSSQKEKLLQCNNIKEININGVVYKKKNEIIKIKPKNMSSKEMDKAPFPDREFLDNKRYLNDGGMGNIQTKRGCDRKCVYCTYPVIEGRRLRFRSPEKVVEEIEILINKYGIDYLHFSDSTFNIPNEHAEAICREMIKRGVKVKWTPYMSPYSPSEELLALVRETGCDGIVFGADSVSDKMLENLKKEFTVADIYKSAELCKKLEIPFSLNLLFGGPGETKETVKETLDNLDKMKPIAVGAMIGIRCYSKTPLSKIALKEGFYKKNNALLEPMYYVSPSIDKDWLIETIQNYAKHRENFFIPASDKGVHTDDLVVEIFRDGIRGPFWEIYKELRKRVNIKK